MSALDVLSELSDRERETIFNLMENSFCDFSDHFFRESLNQRFVAKFHRKQFLGKKNVSGDIVWKKRIIEGKNGKIYVKKIFTKYLFDYKNS